MPKSLTNILNNIYSYVILINNILAATFIAIAIYITIMNEENSNQIVTMYILNYCKINLAGSKVIKSS